MLNYWQMLQKLYLPTISILPIITSFDIVHRNTYSCITVSLGITACYQQAAFSSSAAVLQLLQVQLFHWIINVRCSVGEPWQICRVVVKLCNWSHLHVDSSQENWIPSLLRNVFALFLFYYDFMMVSTALYTSVIKVLFCCKLMLMFMLIKVNL